MSIDKEHARRIKPINESGFKRREYDEFDMHDWDNRDIALYAVRSINAHEATCAKRWGVIVKLMWAILGGVGLIAIDMTSTFLTHLIESAQKAGVL